MAVEEYPTSQGEIRGDFDSSRIGDMVDTVCQVLTSDWEQSELLKNTC